MRAAIALGASVLLMSTAGFAQYGNGQNQAPQINQSTFQKWDGNNNGFLSKKEFMSGARNSGWFKKWDGNKDNRMGRNEFDEIGFEGDFANWDANNSGYLDPKEVYNGVFTTGDKNQDSRWAMGEWEDFGDRGWFDW